MKGLSPEARALIEAGRSGLRGTAADRARIESALRARLGPEALPAADGGARLWGLARGHAFTGAAIGVCALAGVAAWMLRPHAPAITPRTESTRVLAAPVPSEASPPPEEPALSSAPIAPARAAQPARQDRATQEVALLARATRELRSGHASKALRALDEHARRFPNGVLSEERRSARAQALCTLGRVSEGRAEEAQLPARSPTAARAKQVCDDAQSNRD